MVVIPSGFGLSNVCLTKQNGVGKPTIEGESPVSVKKDDRQYPEYHRARGTRWEDGGTILQA